VDDRSHFALWEIDVADTQSIRDTECELDALDWLAANPDFGAPRHPGPHPRHPSLGD
jgi:hypothetical protein